LLKYAGRKKDARASLPGKFCSTEEQLQSKSEVYLQGTNEYESIPYPLIEDVVYASALRQVELTSPTKPLWNLMPESKGVDERKMVGAARLQMRLRKLEERN
jgi:hypothetical protein